MTDITQRLLEIVPAAQVLADDAITDDYTHDESLTCVPERPAVVVLPVTTQDVVAVLRLADESRLPVTARGSGTGLSGGCVPRRGGILLVEFRTVVDSSGGLRERVEQGVGDFRGEPCVSRHGCNSLLP